MRTHNVYFQYDPAQTYPHNGYVDTWWTFKAVGSGATDLADQINAWLKNPDVNRRVIVYLAEARGQMRLEECQANDHNERKCTAIAKNWLTAHYLDGHLHSVAYLCESDCVAREIDFRARGLSVSRSYAPAGFPYDPIRHGVRRI